jgi:protein TonB
LHKEGLYKDPLEKDGLDQDSRHDEVSTKDAWQSDDSLESAANVPAPTFGTRLLLGEEQAGEDGAPKSRKALFAAIAATILLAALGGYWYTHPSAFASAISPGAPHNAPAIQQPPAPQLTAAANTEAERIPATPPAATRPAGAIINQAATPAALNTNMVVTPGHASQPSSSAPTSAAGNSVEPTAPQPAAAQAKHPSLGEVRLAAPTVTRAENTASANDADPSIGLNSSPAPGEGNLGTNFASTSEPAAPSNPIPVGGVVKSAQLLKSVPPVYPMFARSQRVGGDVKIDALIDVAGKVTTMKVVSGPTLLHQAAMDALRLWKYQPATLDGKSVATHLTVTIQFRMQ